MYNGQMYAAGKCGEVKEGPGNSDIATSQSGPGRTWQRLDGQLMTDLKVDKLWQNHQHYDLVMGYGTEKKESLFDESCCTTVVAIMGSVVNGTRSYRNKESHPHCANLGVWNSWAN